MELSDECKLVLKGGRHPDKHQDYLKLYEKLTGKAYPHSKCTGCAVKYLHRFIENYYNKTK